VAVLGSYRVTGRIHEIQAIETILGVLRGAGFPDPEALRIYHAFVDQALAFAALDSASVALPRAAREAEAGVRRATYARLPPTRTRRSPPPPAICWPTCAAAPTRWRSTCC
jgi:hypothetical protein